MGAAAASLAGPGAALAVGGAATVAAASSKWLSKLDDYRLYQNGVGNKLPESFLWALKEESPAAYKGVCEEINSAAREYAQVKTYTGEVISAFKNACFRGDFLVNQWMGD